jgi:hypothetical protein
MEKPKAAAALGFRGPCLSFSHSWGHTLHKTCSDPLQGVNERFLKNLSTRLFILKKFFDAEEGGEKFFQ